MEAGKLRHFIELQALNVGTQDEYGSATETYPDAAFTTYATAWAEIVPLSGREAVNVKQLVAEATHRVTIRYVAGVSAKHRVLFGTRKLYISAPPLNVEERNVTLILTCTEKP